jgi:hypothetical protein
MQDGYETSLAALGAGLARSLSSFSALVALS